MKAIRWLSPFIVVFLLATDLRSAQESAPVETKVKTVMIDPNSQSPVVILETVTDKKPLPIWIDIAEARAIAIELEHIKAPRPLTHDLIRNILQNLGVTLQRVTITDLRDNTYFALLSLSFKGQDAQIDCRPSDAIAIALRMKAPIFASTRVLARMKPVPAITGGTEHMQRRLGIQAQDLTAELANLLDSQHQRGVLVAEVESGSIATKAGIQRGDIITKANDQSVNSVNDLESLIQAAQSPAHIKLEVIKKGKPTMIVIDLP